MVVPDLGGGVLGNLVEYVVYYCVKLARNFRASELVEGIHGCDAVSLDGHFGVEAGCAAADINDRSVEIGGGEVEHALVFGEGATKGDDFLELEGHGLGNGLCLDDI